MIKKPLAKNGINTCKRVSLPFKYLLLCGDSYVRLLGGLYDVIGRNTTVTRSYSLSARLENSGSCCVIVVDTNDAADGLAANIYRRLEENLVSLLRSAKTQVTPFPSATTFIDKIFGSAHVMKVLKPLT